MTHEHLKTLALAAKAAAQTQNWWTADQLGVSGPDTDFIEAASPDAILDLLDISDDRLAQITADRKMYLDLRDENAKLRTALAAAEARIEEMEGQKPCAAIGWCSLYGATCECGVDGLCQRTVNVYLAAGAKA